MNRIGAIKVPELASNQETYTKVAYLLKHAIEQEQDMGSATFVVWSPSGDIDIPIILLAQDFPDTSIIILDKRTWKSSEKTRCKPMQSYSSTKEMSAFSACVHW